MSKTVLFILVVVFALLLFLPRTIFSQSKGYIYVTKKTINENSSLDFDFVLKNSGGTTVKTFTLNDKDSFYLNVYDLGAGHGTGAGELWAIANTSISDPSGNPSGTVYLRQQGSSRWSSTGITSARAIDGAGLNEFVFVRSSDVFYFKNGTSTRIFNNGTTHNGRTVNATDVACGGGRVATVAGNRLYLYSGNFTNDNWIDITGTTGNADRVDIDVTGTNIYYINSNQIYRYNISSGNRTYLGSIGGGGTNDIAIDDNGTLYALVDGGGAGVYRYLSGTSWLLEPEGRGIKRITGGPAGQAWGMAHLGNFAQTIYNRVTDNTGTHLWQDDERVRNSNTGNGNAIMIEVNPGTYTVKETLPNTNWELGRYNIYDPSGNTTANTTSQTVTINVSAGEVVNIEYINEKLNPKQVDNSNCERSILQSFDAGNGANQFGTNTFGKPLEGTAYHYYEGNQPQDGYYYIVKSLNTTNWFSNGGGVSDHTGNGGYLLMVNASYAKDEFYRQRITGLAGSLTYRIEFYVANVSSTVEIQPNIRFGMQTLDGVIFGDSTTGEILGDGWRRFSVSFTVPDGVTTADLFLRNENIGGVGNDLALDDIALNPIPTPLDNNQISPQTTPNLCIGNTYQFYNSVPGGTWSSSNTGVATIDATGKVSIKKTGDVTFTYTYVNNIFCVSTATSDISIHIPPSVNVTASTSTSACKGDTLTLYSVSSGGTPPYTYQWTGNGGMINSPTVPNPLLTASNVGGLYQYSIKVTDKLGCTSSADAFVAVHVPEANINPFCYPNSNPPFAQLVETGGTPNATRIWSSSTQTALFYNSSNLTGGTKTSSLQSPYVNIAGNYKVVVKDEYGCKDSASVLYDRFACQALPVTLISFEAIKQGNGVVVQWLANSTGSNVQFLLERSTDQKNWLLLKDISAKENRTGFQKYDYNDAQPLNGTNYYRLRIMDDNGSIFTSRISIVSFGADWKFKIYPNPVSGTRLQFYSNRKLAELVVSDIYGKRIIDQKLNTNMSTFSLNISSLTKGVYFIEVVNAEGESLTQRFVRQ
jgi:hypothetical protein